MALSALSKIAKDFASQASAQASQAVRSEILRLFILTLPLVYRIAIVCALTWGMLCVQF